MKLPALLAKYRATLAAYSEAVASREEYERKEQLTVDESNDADDLLHEEYFEPYFLARGLLLAAVCLGHNMDPRRPIPRPIAVTIGRALVVVAPDWNDSADHHVYVVEPPDVIAVETDGKGRPHKAGNGK